VVALGIALILGNNLPDTDDWTESLITNDEVLAIDQDPLALGAKRVSQAGGSEVWVKPMKDGSKAIGLFNRGDAPDTAALDWTAAGLAGSQRLRDVWQHGDLGMFQGTFSSPVPAHGVVLVVARGERRGELCGREPQSSRSIHAPTHFRAGALFLSWMRSW
jgi:alpha-galactosidase